jgi:glycerol-3-phosphate acyltransferase PlsX
MRIIIDAFGGDNAPLEVIKGSAETIKNSKDLTVILCGDEGKIRAAAKSGGISLDGMEFIHTESVIEIEDEPVRIIKDKSDCSMALGLKALSEGRGDAFVSAGSTGALVAGATFITKRVKGIKRPALCPLLPTAKKHFMLADAGANTECRPEMLVQFAGMASEYMEKVMGRNNPRVGLLNIGTEDTKGRELELKTYALLKDAPINFVGNIEAREMPQGTVDVVITDGFTGNIALKLYEGMGSFFGKRIKKMFTANAGTKFGSLFLLSQLKKLKDEMNPSKVGGAVLIGVSKPVIKAHGNSNAIAFMNAIRQAEASCKLTVDN